MRERREKYLPSQFRPLSPSPVSHPPRNAAAQLRTARYVEVRCFDPITTLARPILTPWRFTCSYWLSDAHVRYFASSASAKLLNGAARLELRLELSAKQKGETLLLLRLLRNILSCRRLCDRYMFRIFVSAQQP